jgi:hypothetical protein
MLPRYTYIRDGRASTLDDIFVGEQDAQLIINSGIWLDTLHSSDHIGVPFCVLKWPTDDTRLGRLKGVRPIYAINTKDKTQDDLMEYQTHLQTHLCDGTAQLIEEVPEGANARTTHQWLDRAIQNLYDVMFKAAEEL